MKKISDLIDNLKPATRRTLYGLATLYIIVVLGQALGEHEYADAARRALFAALFALAYRFVPAGDDTEPDKRRRPTEWAGDN